MEQWNRRAEELDPDAFLTLWARQLTTSAMHDGRSIEAGQTALAASGRHVFPLLILGLDLATYGDTEGARAVYDEARSRGRREYVPLRPPSRCSRPRLAKRRPRWRIAARPSRSATLNSSSSPSAGLTARRCASMPEHRAMLVEIGLPGALAAASGV